MPPVTFVDVFSSAPFAGNPVAVVHEASGLDDDRMLAVTRWLDLSETTFLVPPTDPDADYAVRIFTPAGELPFAGHPTLGTCHAWLEAGGVPTDVDVVVQECGAGLVRVRRTPEGLSFAAPPMVRSGVVAPEDLARVVDVLGITESDVEDAAWVDNGPGWVAVRLASAEAVLALRPSPVVDAPTFIGAVGPHPAGSDTSIEVRGFFTDQHLTLREDPVTGSLNASIAQWLLRSSASDGPVLAAPYVAAQGTALGRSGRVSITEDDGVVWVGGATRTAVAGHVDA
jgi:PhzF family phenazine biosynthesis protein